MYTPILTMINLHTKFGMSSVAYCQDDWAQKFKNYHVTLTMPFWSRFVVLGMLISEVSRN